MSDRHVTVQQNPYAQVPEALGYDTGISDGAFRVYFALLRHGTNPDNCYPSHARIGNLIGKSPRSINRLVVELEAAGWIERVERYDAHGGRTSDGYWVRQVPVPDGTPPTQNREGVAQPDDGDDIPAQDCVEGAHDSASPAHDSGEPPRTDAGTPRARVREERKPVNDSPLTTENPPNPPAGGAAQEPPQLSLVAPVAEPSPAETFDHFWKRYPARGGKRVGKGKAFERWRKLDVDTQRLACKGAAAYAAYCADTNRLPKDPERWLRDRLWEDFIGDDEPAEVDITDDRPPSRSSCGNISKLQKAQERMRARAGGDAS